MRRFVPVPYEAIRLAASDAEYLLIAKLYERAHSGGWAEIRLPVREIAKIGGVRIEETIALLDALEGAGLIVRNKGTNRRTGSVRVLDPTAREQSGTLTTTPKQETAERLPERSDVPPTPAIPEPRNADRNAEPRSGSERFGTPPARVVDTRAPNQTRPDLSTEADHTPEESEIEKTRANAGDSVVFARAKDRPTRKTPEEAWQVQRCATLAGVAVVSGMSVMPPAATDRIVSAMRSSWTPEDFDLLWAWSADSHDRQAVLSREHSGVQRWTWLLAGQREDRRAAAKEWDRRGRTDTPSAARSPPSGRQQKAGLNDLISFVDDRYFPGEPP